MVGKGKKKTVCRWITALFLIALVVWTVWANTAVESNSYTISSRRLPAAFDGYKIAHVSDLHNAQLDEGNESLLQILRQAQPDMIAITGDLIDSRKLDMEVAMAFIRQAVQIAPCYYVTGNHEARLNSQYNTLKREIEAAGVTVLEDETVQITKDGESVTLIGLQDPSFHGVYQTENIEKLADEQLTELHTDDSYSILLFHRPSYFPIYATHGIDLILSGHMHGGQFRLPFVGGLYTPSHGFFPDYDGGLYTEGNSNMLVSRGLGNSAFPFRFNNRPEILLIQLKTE